jgi:multidrug efflux system membrane fusion protein
MTNKKVRYKLLLIALAVVFVTGCNKKDQTVSESAVPQAPPVEIVTVEAAPYTETAELPGRIEPVRVAEVRARVAGIVLSRNFEEGSDVKEGQVLFQIDPAPFKAALSRAEANVAKAEASLYEAQAVVERYGSLVKIRAISPQKYDTAVANLKGAQAARRSARAEVETASLSLGYATVRAPISGRIGRALVTEGSLVGQGETTALATIQQLDPIFADFTQPVSEFLRLRAALTAGKASPANATKAQVTITLEEISYTQQGHFLFTDVTVDRTTGQVSLRSEFPNPDGMLLPGMFVRIKTELGTTPQAIFVPQRAVRRTPDGAAQVMVVDGKGVAQAQSVKMGPMEGRNWQVLEGLKPGEKVVVNGANKVQPGMQFNVVQTEDANVKSSEG